VALTEADKAKLLDNGFVYAGTSYAKCLACGHVIFLGDPEDVNEALAHRSQCLWGGSGLS